MKTFTVQFKHQPEARAKVCGIRAETAAQAIAEAARDLRLTPDDVGDPVNDTADFSSILEAIDTTPAAATKQIYKLATHVKNPDFDKRRAHGYRALPAFDQGTTFAVYEADERSPTMIDLGTCHISGKLADLLVSQAHPVEPTTWHDIGLTCGGYGNCASDVIDQLLRSGAVTPQQVTQALNQFLSQ
jgi:hypothetical protein